MFTMENSLKTILAVIGVIAKEGKNGIHFAATNGALVLDKYSPENVLGMVCILQLMLITVMVLKRWQAASREVALRAQNNDLRALLYKLCKRLIKSGEVPDEDTIEALSSVGLTD